MKWFHFKNVMKGSESSSVIVASLGGSGMFGCKKNAKGGFNLEQLDQVDT